METNEEYVGLLGRIRHLGTPQLCRGFRTRELIHSVTVIPMTRPLVTLARRRLGYRFACAEAAWILSGDNRVATIARFSPKISSFSDDGVYFYGAYGPKIVDQLSHVVSVLVADHGSRQAVINIWREKPAKTNDLPCTLSAQFLIRDDTLHCIDTMRSSDAWLGVPYDWFNFSMLSAYVALRLRCQGVPVTLGNLYLAAASQHLYDSGFGYDGSVDVQAVLDDATRLFDYAPLDLAEFDTADDLVMHLWHLARHESDSLAWLAEIADITRGRL